MIDRNILNKLDRIIPQENFAVATSGGIDSLALSLICKSLLKRNFIAIIVDHKYRDNSSKEALKVEKLLKTLEINSVILKNEKPIPKSNIEKYLREVRYELINSYCKSNRIDTVLTGHHLDDNIETFLMRLERGASIDGLASIKKINNINGIKYIRPFLDIDKSELRNYLEENKVGWFEDETNKSNKFTRNKIRKALEEVVDYPTLKKRLSNVIKSLERSSDFIKQEVNKAENNIFLEDNIIDRKKFLELHEEIGLRVLKNKILEFYIDSNKFRFDKVNRIFNLIKSGNTKTEIANVKITISENEIIFTK